MNALIDALQFIGGPVILTHCNYSKQTFMWLAAFGKMGSWPPFAAWSLNDRNRIVADLKE